MTGRACGAATRKKRRRAAEYWSGETAYDSNILLIDAVYNPLVECDMRRHMARQNVGGGRGAHCRRAAMVVVLQDRFQVLWCRALVLSSRPSRVGADQTAAAGRDAGVRASSCASNFTIGAVSHR